MKDESTKAALGMHIIFKAEQELTTLFGKRIELKIVASSADMTYKDFMLFTLQQYVCDAFSVTWAQLVRQSRKDYNRIPRQAFCYLAKDLLGMSLMEIARMVNYGDHSVVLNAIKRVSEFIETGDDIGEKVLIIKAKFNENKYQA